MNNEKRPRAAVRRALLAMMLMPLVAGAAPTDDMPAPQSLPAVVIDAVERYANDPAGAIAALQALRADSTNPAYAAAGLPLLRTTSTSDGSTKPRYSPRRCLQCRRPTISAK